MKKSSFIVNDPDGLYAGPVNNIVSQVTGFASQLTLTYDMRSVNMKSIMGMTSLGVPYKGEVEITIDGPDEEDALKAIREILKKENIIEK